MDNKKLIAGFITLLLSSTAVTSNTTTAVTCDWTGMYFGGFAGGSTGSHITSTEPLRLDNNAYWFRPFNNSFSYRTRPSFIGGITIGYNLQIGTTPFLAGIEGEYGYLNLRGSSVDSNQFPYSELPNNNLQNSSRNVINIGKSSGYTLIAARVIYEMDHQVLFYIKSGAVFTRIRSKYNSVKTEDLAPVYLNMSGAKNIVGYGVGGGIEYVLPFEGFSNMSTKIEYLFLGLNKRKYVYGHCSCNFLWRMIERIQGVNTIKIGINYKFG
jgi:opacity protein-like surface antigen